MMLLRALYVSSSGILKVVGLENLQIYAEMEIVTPE